MIFVGAGRDGVYAEEGNDRIYAFADGVSDDLYCAKASEPSSQTDILYFDTREGFNADKDNVVGCKVEFLPQSEWPSPQSVYGRVLAVL